MVGQGHLKDDAAGRSSRILVRSLSQVSGFSTYGSQPTDSRRREREFVHLFSRAVRLHQFGLGTMVAAACQSCQSRLSSRKKSVQSLPQDAESLSLVVRTSCRGRDNPGSTPGGDTARIYAEAGRQKLAKAFSQPSAFPEASVV